MREAGRGYGAQAANENIRAKCSKGKLRMQVGSAIVTVVVRSLGDRDRRRELNSLTSLRSGLSRDRGRPPEKWSCRTCRLRAETRHVLFMNESKCVNECALGCEKSRMDARMLASPFMTGEPGNCRLRRARCAAALFCACDLGLFALKCRPTPSFSACERGSRGE